MRRQSEHLDDYRAALGRLGGAGPDLSKLREPRRDRRGGSRIVKPPRRRGRAIPTARRSIPAAPGICRRRSGRNAWRPASPMRCGSTWPPRRCAPARLPGPKRAPGRRAKPEPSRRRRKRGATWSWRARRRRPATISSVTVDDALQGVTHVVRGADLFWSTSVHRLLQALLGLPAPLYRHHRLVIGARRPQAVEVDARDGAARAARARRERRRHPDDDRPCARRALTFRLRLRAMVADGTDHDTQDRDTGTQRGRKSARKPTRVRHGERFRSRLRSPRSRMRCARRSTASWRLPNCLRLPTCRSANADGQRRSKAPAITSRGSPRSWSTARAPRRTGWCWRARHSARALLPPTLRRRCRRAHRPMA